MGWNASAYDRQAALRYADEYASTFGDDSGYNTEFFINWNLNNQGGDCANFVSQALIAGDVHFSAMDNVAYPVDVKGSVINVRRLAPALQNNLGARIDEYTTAELPTTIPAGMPLFLLDGSPIVDYYRHSHAMLIAGANQTGVFEQTYDGHNENRKRYPVLNISLRDDWIVRNQKLQVYNLAGMPIIKLVELTQNINGEEKIVHRWKYDSDYDPETTSPLYFRNTYNGITPDSIAISDNPNIAGSGELLLKIVFDTTIKQQSFLVKFGKNAPEYNEHQFETVAWSATHQFSDTWTGRIVVPANDESYTGTHHLKIHAESPDASGLDDNSDLSSYNPADDVAHGFKLDSTAPTVTASDSRGTIQLNGATDGKGISINADDRRVGGGGDPPIVSGLAKIEIWKGGLSAAAGGTLLASNSDPYDTDHIYTKDDPGLAVLDQLPEGEIFVRVADKAGNDTSVRFEISPPVISMSDVMFQGYAPNVYESFTGVSSEIPSTVVPSFAFGGSQRLFITVEDPAGLDSISAPGLSLFPALTPNTTSYTGFLALPLDAQGVRPPIRPGTYTLTAKNSNQRSSVAPVRVAGMGATITSFSGTYNRITRDYTWSITLALTSTLGLNRIERLARATGNDPGERLMEVRSLSEGGASVTYTESGTETGGLAGALDAMVFDVDGNSIRFAYFVFPEAIESGKIGSAFVGPTSGTQFAMGSYLGRTVPLGAGVTITDLVTDSNLNIDLALGAPIRAPSGWKTSGSASYFLTSQKPTSPNLPTLSIPFQPTGLSAAQIAEARLGRRTSGTERMGVDVMAANRTTNALTVKTLLNGAYSPIVPIYENPEIAAAGDGAELLYDGTANVAVSFGLAGPSDPVAADLLAQARLLGYNLQGSLYLAGPHGTSFSPPAYITLPGAETNHDQTQIIELSEGRAPHILPSQDRDNPNKITAPIDRMNSYFGLFMVGSGGSGGAGELDLTPPVTTLRFGGFFASTTGAAGIINEISAVTLQAVDSGVGQVRTYYAIDPSSAVIFNGLNAATTGAFTVYGDPFPLIPGRRVVAYGSVDGSGNYEVLRTTEVVVESSAVSASDITPPVTALGFSGFFASTAGAAGIINESSSITLTAIDSGAGPVRTFYAVDPESAILSAGLNAGTTEVFTTYVGAFSLIPGQRVVAYGSVDGAGNYEALQSTMILVRQQPSIGPSEPDDLLPPRTSFSAGAFQVIGPTTFVSRALGFTVADDGFVIGDGLGVGATQTFYAADGATYSPVTDSFLLVAEGTHTVSFFSVDRKGNAEQAQVRSISVDLTPPQSALSSNGVIYSIDTIDPPVAGAKSGVAEVLYWVDVNPGICAGVVPDTGAARGTCANPAYAGPFPLSPGQHTVYFQAVDAVGNRDILHADNVSVSNPDAASSSGLGIGRDPFDAFWSVVSVNDALSFARADSFGALISSTSLLDAAFGLPWSVFFDAAGRAYAIGLAEGPSTRAADVAVYKATPAGDAIEARILFDSGYANNDLVLDAKAPGWLVGAAQTSGPADFEAAGERSFALALWKFDPALGAVTLSTTFARGAFDVGAGVAVDADGSLWISGYSLRPDAPAVRGFDLALWHYAANGKTLLGGPFLWPGYLSDFDGTATARVHVSGGSVYIAAPRVNVSSGTDMAFLRFDKVTSRATSESVWRASDGSASYPAAILPEAAGLIVAGGIGAGESQAALWRFGYDGALRGATLADAGGAQGAVLRGAELWLSVDGSTLPYKVLVETPAAGSLIDISTPPAQALAVTSIAPGSATAGTSVAAAVAGTGFDASAALSLERSDVLRGTWTATGSFAQARFSSTLTKLRDGRVLLAGGMLEGSAVGLSAVDLYDPATGIWTAGPPLRQGRNQFASVLLADGRVLVAGGMNGTVIGSVEIYDPTLNTWTAAAPMAYARVGYQLALLSNGRVLAAGGWNGSSALNSAEIYDPVANAWSPAAAMSVGRINPAMTALGNGKVLISGGNNNSSSNASAEVYDPATNAWSAAGSMSAARYLHRFAVLPGGKVLASGGANASATTDSADVYDPATNGWTATGPLGVRRYIHAVVLVNGTPLIIGGENFSTALASTEMYDAAANAWRPGPSLSGTRTWLQAAVLDDGRVLVAGGRRGLGGGTNLNSAELLGTPSAQISATGVTVTDSQRLSGALSLDGAATGKWDVVVRQSGGHIARLAGGFQVLPGAPTLASIAVTPASASILIGATAQFAAAGTYSDGSTRTLTGEVAWSTDVSSVATVTATGLATGVAGGTVRVIASSGTISGRAALTVTVPPLAVTSIAPSSAAAGASVAAAVAGTGFDASAALSLERSDAMRGTWAATGSFTQARMLGTMTKLRDGRVLLAGGMLEGSAVGLSAVDLYDPATGLWTAGPPLRQGRNQHASVMLADGRVLVAGGMNGTVIGSVEIYDPTLNTWTAVAPMASARVGHQLALLSNGRVLAAGGWNGSSVLNSAEIYDPVVNAWSPAASMSVGRINPAMTTLGNGKVLISGGNDNNSVTHASAEIYDPANTWSAAGTMSAARYGHRFVVLPGGKVLAAGGANASATTDSADVYDPATNVWTATGRLGVRRYYHAMVLVNGTPLIIGGENFSTALASTEIYDAAANAWRSGPSLSGMRAHLHAAVLDDGRVLVAGGRRGLGGGTNLNSAELLGTPSVQVAATGVTVTDAQRLSGTLSLTGAATGYWDVVVRETGGRVGRLAGGFQVLPGAPMLASITVTPVSASILAGATAQFAAAGTFTDGSTRTLTGEVAWSTDVSSVATVSAAGLATGVGGGTSRVIAASGAIVGRAALNVAYVATSTVAVGGSPELTLVSTAPLSVVIASTEAGAGAVALGSAAAQGLTLVGTVYDVTRQDPGASAILTWSFDPELVDASTLAIWRFDGISWSSVTVLNQVVSVAGGVGTVTGEVTLTSLFGLFVRDVVAPVTTLLVDGLPSGATSRLIAPASTISFAAVDAGMGVRETRYGLDGGPETVFVSPFRLTEGMHALAYRSIDRAGNLEDAKSASIAVDATAPRTSLIATGGRQYPGVGAAGFYASSDTRIGLAAEDPLVHGVASGLASTEFKETGGAFQAFVASLALTEGAHSFGYRSRDNVGNLELLKSATVFVDAIPPVSAVAVGAPSVTAADGTVHVVPASPIAFTATDPALPSGQAGAGVERVEVSVDGGAFVPAAGPLTFAEGRHDVLYRALDNVGNVETSRALSIQSDATPPATTLAISTPVSGGYVSGAARFVLAAVDPVVDGAASGVKFVRYRVNGGAFVTGPLDFGLSGPDGAYTLEYQSEDNIGHLEVMRSTAVILDRTPPVTMVQVGASSFTAADGTLYVDPAAPVTLAAADSASGVGRIAVSVDGAPFAAYTAALTFAEGRHTVQYRAVDKVGNEEPLRTLSLSSDATPPLTMFVPSGALFKAGERSYAPAQFTYALAAQDPVAGSVASGAALTRYRMTPGAYQNFAAAFSLSEGVRRVEFQSQDNVGNVEVLKSATVFVDATSPVTALAVGNPRFDPGNGLPVFVAAATPLTLSAQDPEVQDVASGVRQISFHQGSAPFGVYSAPFTLPLPDGLKTVDYFAADNVGNAEVARSTSVVLDNTAPASSLAVLGGRQFPGPNAASFYASSDTRLSLPAVDPMVNGVASGLAATQWQDNGGAFQAFTAAFALPEGAHVLSYQSQDRVKNSEVLRSTTILIDAAPPVTTAQLGAPLFTSVDGVNYIAPATPVTLSAVDPALPTGQPGSGVSRIEVAIDGGPFTAYSTALTFAEGRHTILYRAVDNVVNVEGVRTLQIRSDATPPASSLVVGEPKFQLPGSLLVSTRTPFSITSADPVRNDVASGVKDTSFRISGASAFSAFTAPFMMAGADAGKVIEFHSRDNVLNAEAVKSSAVLLDSTPPEVALLSPASCGAGICRVLKGRFPVLGTAQDRHFQSYALEFAPGKDSSAGFALISSGTVAVSSGPLGTWDAAARSGWLTLRLTAADLVANAASVSLNVFVGDPGQSLVLGNHEIFDMPEGVAAGGDGKIYVADRNNDRIAVFSSTGALLASLGGRKDDEDDDDEDEDDDEHKKSTATLRLNKPSGVAVDAAGNIYVADTNRDRVLKLSAAGQVLLTLGQFHHPAGVAVDAASNIYVADTGNRRVQVFSSTGAFSLQFSLPPVPVRLNDDDDGDDDDDAEGRVQLGKPSGIAVDAAGNIYVADSKGGRALKFSAAGQLLLTIPIPGDKPGKFGQPFGVAVSSGGDCLLVSDRKTSRILKFDFLGNANLAFGSKGKIKDDDDAPVRRSAIVFKKPMGLALDSQGNLFVADRNNNRIQKLGLPTSQAPLVVPPPRPGEEHIARDVVDTEDGGKVERGDRAAVDIPAGAVALDLKISVSTPTFSVVDDSNRRRAAEDARLKAASPPVEYGPEGTKFKGSVTLTLPYSSDLVALQKIDAKDLIVRYWNREKTKWEDLESVVDPKTRTVKAKTTHFSLYQVFSGTVSAAAISPLVADAAFTFHDAYAFPNPARGVNTATIRMQTGLADSVEVRVYDVSGRKIHASSNFSLNPSLDDGNGKGEQYTYDHAWDVSGVGSGVYLYVITAKKAGHSDIHKTGRIGVVK